MKHTIITILTVLAFITINAQTPTQMRTEYAKWFTSVDHAKGMTKSTFSIPNNTIYNTITIEGLYRFSKSTGNTHSLAEWKKEMTGPGGADRYAQTVIGSWRRNAKVYRNITGMGLTHYKVSVIVDGKKYTSSSMKIQ